MPGFIGASIAFLLGLLLYVGLPALGPALPIHWRRKVGNTYISLAMRSFQRVALVRRLIGWYELLPLAVDDERKVAQVTLSSGVLGSDKNLPFRDPDKRIHRLVNKSLALLCEPLPAAIDAELAELGYWTERADDRDGLFDDATGQVDPYIPVEEGLRIIDPIDCLSIAGGNAVEPETIETAEELTKQRFSKYGSPIGMAETVGAITGFLVGVGVMLGIAWLKNNTSIIDGSGGGLPDPDTTIQLVMDVGVMVL